MMKDLLFQQRQQQQQALEENMSNLTSASGEASASSGNRTEAGTNYPQQYFSTPPPRTQLVKKKRNLPGNPDPDAEVIALSPKTLMATNRFVCEICSKGFQRDQNLQLHRRGHNLPWKLKQRASKEVRKKVYVCPEPSCVHHDPSRALGDLTGIKKHFFRKHGEKTWKCDKCSKRYAVQSDWKAHSKTCGTREYRCDCGTLFSRRDSFITHRAFCDALAEESARAITGANPLLSPHQPSPSLSTSHINLQVPQFNPQDIQLQAFSLKKEQQSFTTLRPEIPPWLASQPMLGAGRGPTQPIDLSFSSSSIFSTRLDHQEFTQTHHQDLTLNENPNPNPSLGSTLPPYHPTTVPSPQLSATALLQKAAQMGATMTCKAGSSSAPATTATAAAVATSLMRPHQQTHVSADSAGNNSTTTASFGLNLSSREELAVGSGFIHGLAPFGNHKPAAANAGSGAPPSLLQDMMNSLSSATRFDVTSFDDAFGGILNTKNRGSFINESLSKTTTPTPTTNATRNDNQSTGGSTQGEELTRDFLGLRAFSHSDILNITGLNNCMNTSQEQPNQSQKTWQG
ncbi:protein indeterminate-domain 7-like [Durio zibethinus]|uniref:Protein indeterminate-domain 7-like n=1 Tax=Durio zibethinus TaxID=66656 RepID=A0A6P5XAK9_DURZI|nr:protein indeterminate-domain 7-like [Durio zibethinus]XP_022724639.1 protein indeterminate-domain 7-like [Durio zibethinus]XP_022724640.1 protein indeterminate-domain 7-like [Durio zibethinus]XP_022724641.1 protein indeterminate-domain 7-like [Durio zibethinus]XP_022724642.1 protein indeterminate-domain 7-like [Durio zibethinus]